MTYSYKQAQELLCSQGRFYINLGLDRIEKILDKFDNPQDKINIIHVAGTNGKGSVCSVLANILTCSGYKTGLYTSPHLVEYTERIKINNKNISDEDFAAYIEKICKTADKENIDLTEFEILTAAAFLYFSDNKVDIAIMETGLGGRFDATNVIKNPLMSVITSISKDHTDRLGDTLEKIAFEKAGIIKQNSKVVTATSNNGFEVIEKIAREKDSKLYSVFDEAEIIYENGINYIVINGSKYEFPLLGLYQKQNMALVLKAVEILEQSGYKISLKDGLKTVKWAARLEYNKEKNILIDGAHNPDSALELRKSLDFYFPDKKRIFVYSTIDTKDYVSIAKILFHPDDEIYYLNFNHKNAVKYENYIKEVPFLTNIKPILKQEFFEIIKNPNLKVITGSLYMIGEIYNDI
ncbi:bifunctional folylpolyglutamate synthase/dihydrofolate synthase [bacterium]|nr:bifunctional folylpolyglutamate synthase/dihydrofolate synthase [bacterium]